LRYQRVESFRFLLPLVPVRAQMLYPLDVSKQEFLYFARSFPRSCSISMRNRFISRRIIGTGSDASGSGAEDVRTRG
jgi:hypothetical protein